MKLGINQVNFIKNYIQNYDVEDVVYNGESINELRVGTNINWSLPYPFLNFTLLDDDTYEVSAVSDTQEEITIPSSYKGKWVSSIASEGFKYFDKLKKINIPDSVKNIGSNAFERCQHLTDVYIPDCALGQSVFSECVSLHNVKFSPSFGSVSPYIPSYAFYGCSSLEHITITDNVKYIDGYAFEECSDLSSIVFGNSVESIGFAAFSTTCGNLTTIYTTGGSDQFMSLHIADGNEAFNESTMYTFSENMPTSSGTWWYYDINGVPTIWDDMSFGLEYTSNGDGTCDVISIGTCTDIDVVIPSTSPDGDIVTSIGDSAFYECYSLNSIIIPDSVITIGESAFDDCDSLSSVVIGDGVKTIGDYAFYRCLRLNQIEIPNSVETIGMEAFAHCSGLTSVTAYGTISIPNKAFQSCTALKTVSVNTLTNIGNYAFSGCTALTYLGYTGPITNIGSYAFQNCSSLPSIRLADTIQTIEPFAFYGCTSLTQLNIPDNVTTIDKNAFQGCTSLRSVTGCKNLTTLKSSAFEDCVNLSTFAFKPALTSIGSYAFANCYSINITTGLRDTSVTRIEGQAFNCKNTSSIVSGTRNTVALPLTITYIGAYALPAAGISYVDLPVSTWDVQYDATDAVKITITSSTSTATQATWLTTTYRDKYWYRTDNVVKPVVTLDTEGNNISVGVTALGLTSGSSTTCTLKTYYSSNNTPTTFNLLSTTSFAIGEGETVVNYVAGSSSYYIIKVEAYFANGAQATTIQEVNESYVATETT